MICFCVFPDLKGFCSCQNLKIQSLHENKFPFCPTFYAPLSLKFGMKIIRLKLNCLLEYECSFTDKPFLPLILFLDWNTGRSNQWYLTSLGLLPKLKTFPKLKTVFPYLQI